MKDYGNAQKGKRLIAAMAWSRDRKSVMLGKMLRAAASAMSCRAGAVALLVPVRLSVAMVKWRATRSVMMVQTIFGADAATIANIAHMLATRLFCQTFAGIFG